jgi:hypothetical protein
MTKKEVDELRKLVENHEKRITALTEKIEDLVINKEDLK